MTTDTREGLVEALRDQAASLEHAASAWPIHGPEVARTRDRAKAIRDHADDLEALRDAENLGEFFEVQNRILRRLTPEPPSPT